MVHFVNGLLLHSFADSRPATTQHFLNLAPGAAARNQPVYGVIARLINWRPLYFPSLFALGDPLLLPFPALFIVSPGDGGQHIQQHIVYGRKHSAVKIIVTRCEPGLSER